MFLPYCCYNCCSESRTRNYVCRIPCSPQSSLLLENKEYSLNTGLLQFLLRKRNSKYIFEFITRTIYNEKKHHHGMGNHPTKDIASNCSEEVKGELINLNNCNINILLSKKLERHCSKNLRAPFKSAKQIKQNHKIYANCSNAGPKTRTQH